MKLVIDRKTWRRGPQDEQIKLDDPTALLCKDGAKCCLGFYALQCGLTKEQIYGIGEPGQIPMNEDDADSYWLKLVKFYDDDYTSGLANTSLAAEAMDINDDPNLTEEEREQKLIKIFSKKDIEVKFV